MSRMLDFKERNRVRRAMYAKPTIIVLAVVFVMVANGAWGMYEKSRDATDKTDVVTQRLTELEAREKELSLDILDLSTERGIEGEILDRFMVAKEGENVIIVADPTAEKVHTVTVPDETPGVTQKVLSAVGLSN